jgi:hypothetical protein
LLRRFNPLSGSIVRQISLLMADRSQAYLRDIEPWHLALAAPSLTCSSVDDVHRSSSAMPR